MANFLDTLRGLINTDPLNKNSQLDIRNITRQNGTNNGGGPSSGRNTSGRRPRILEAVIDSIIPLSTYNAGESTPVIPKAPAFRYYDPVSEWLRNSNMRDEAKKELWDRHQKWMDNLDDNRKTELRQKLNESNDYLDSYVNALMEEGYREEGERRERENSIENRLRNYMRINFGGGVGRNV